jgi:hypothetical protein
MGSECEMGMSLYIRLTTDTHERTGHKILTPDRWWERFSIFSPFFWSTKQTVTNIAFSANCLSWCFRTRPRPSLKTMCSVVSRLVRPGFSVTQNSQALIAKK